MLDRKFNYHLTILLHSLMVQCLLVKIIQSFSLFAATSTAYMPTLYFSYRSRKKISNAFGNTKNHNAGKFCSSFRRIKWSSLHAFRDSFIYVGFFANFQFFPCLPQHYVTENFYKRCIAKLFQILFRDRNMWLTPGNRRHHYLESMSHALLSMSLFLLRDHF